MNRKYQMHKKERRMIYFVIILTLASLLLHQSIPYLLDPSFAEAVEIENLKINESPNLDRKQNQHLNTKEEKKNNLNNNTHPKLKRKNKNPSPKNHSAKSIQRKTEAKTKRTYPKLNPRSFDPNKVSVDELKAMKLAPFLSERIDKYRNKGGKFYQKDDLKKIYGMTDSIYQILESYIIIPVEKKQHYKNEMAVVSIIDINSATAKDFQSLRGIGPVLSGRIVKYRDLLGGFHDVQQISETYGLPDSTFLSINQYLRLSDVPKSININLAQINDLKKHPYISYHLAKVIINYRKQHGNFAEVEDIKKIKIISEEDYRKILPYLAV